MNKINNFVANLNIRTGTSKLSDETRKGLWISLAVVLTFAIIMLIVTFVLKNKYSKKIVSKDEQIELSKLREKNPNYGVVLDGIKKYYKKTVNDHMIAYLVNTIYLNNYESILVSDNNDYVGISLANLANRKTIIDSQTLFRNNKEEILKEFPDLDFKNVFYQPANQTSDLIVSLNEDLSIKNQIDKFLPLLSDNGILIISFDHIKSFKQDKNYLFEKNVRYETAKFGFKNIILIAKNNLNDKIEYNQE
ncbi:hypothetical protein FJO69_01170 [[Mycoplasma] falconis]|uniref:Methyltransferase n=1 Tax=[Mycoplasma] falconis TaxID=92403 RepID=A0A501XA78_9BACT|nr:hypothetical protein [[Mycoplasma] falconis]TPE57528.1 hypothetical protein FJO69_01170 [[Mycoplasma] falconis]